MKEMPLNVRSATAIAAWAIVSLGVVAIAAAGDRTFFRAEPASPAKAALVGLVMLLAIGWPIWSCNRLVGAFVIGQGAVSVMFVATNVVEGVAIAGMWIGACAIALTGAWLSRERHLPRARCWTVAVAGSLGAGGLMLLRGGLER